VTVEKIMNLSAQASKSLQVWRVNVLRKALEMAKRPEEFTKAHRSTAAKFSRYLDKYIGSPIHRTSTNARDAPVDGTVLPRARYVYNPQFVSMVPGDFPDQAEKPYFISDFEDYALLLDTTLLRVHRRYNMIEFRRSGENVLAVPTSIARRKGIPEPSPFMFEPGFYEEKPHPYDAEACVPGYFLGGCAFVMEQLLEKIWGHCMYEGLTSERDFLYEKFLRVVHEFGVKPGDIDKCMELSQLREFLEIFIMKTDKMPRYKMVAGILVEHPHWSYTKDLIKIHEKGDDESEEGRLKIEEEVKEYLENVVKDCFSSRVEDRLHDIGRQMFSFRVPRGAKKNYEAALLEIVKGELQALPAEMLEDPIDLGSELIGHPRLADEEKNVTIGAATRYKTIKNIPRRRMAFRKSQISHPGWRIFAREESAAIKKQQVKRRFLHQHPEEPEMEDFPTMGLDQYEKKPTRRRSKK
jgi:hypothetical protein